MTLMDRCLIVFDLDEKLLEQHYHNTCWRNGYDDIQRLLFKHRFTNLQGTVYLGERGVRQAHGTLALQEIAIRFPWFEKSVSNIRFYALADAFNGQFIVDGVAAARGVFEHRMALLRQRLIAEGLTPDKIDEIIGQEFSIETFPLDV